MINKLKTFIFNLNEKGIPLPLIRDPKTNEPSVTMTMMLIAFTIAAGSLIGKFAQVLGDLDTSGANYLFLTTAGLYLGRRMSADGKTTEIEKDDK